MRVERIQSNLPLVDQDGRPTQITQVALEKLVAEVIALRAVVADHETRIVALEL